MLNGLGRHAVTASKSSNGQRTKVVATFGGNTSIANNMASRTSNTQMGIYDRDVLDGFVNYQDIATIRRIARDIYDFDPVSGLAVDMLSNLPFSQFELTGLPDQKMLNVYAENLNAMDISSSAPEIAKNYMIDGEFIGMVSQAPDSNVLTGIVPVNVDACQFTTLPIPTRDPIIDVLIPSDLKSLLRSKDPRVVRELQKFGKLEEMSRTNSFPLDPTTTIYFPRRTMATVSRGTSYFKRIIPVWLVEKALMKGTIDLAHRRQRSLLHLMIGDEEYLPTEAQLGQYTDLFRRADADPLGAIVATRPQVQTNEIRNGSDFWRVDESGDWFVQQKLRGLGISESLISGDLTVDATTNVMTVFLENLRFFRENFTRKIYYHKVLLLIAINNGFTVDKGREEITSDDNEIDAYLRDYRLIDGRNAVIALDDISYKLSDYHLPKIQYHKALKPEGNNELLQNLNTLTTAGLPIPLRIWATTAGLSIPELLRMTGEDITLRKQLAAYKAKWPVDPNAQAQQLLQSADSINEIIANSIRAEKRPRNRDFSSIIYKDPLTKKELSKKGLKVVNERADRTIAQAQLRINANHNAKIKDERPVNRKTHYFSKPFGLLEVKGLQ